MAVPGRRLELGVELHAHVPRVHRLRQLDHLGQLLALGDRGDHEAGVLQALQVLLVGLVAVAVALGDDVAIDAVRDGAGLDVRALRAQAHRAAEVGVGIAPLDRAVGVLPLVDQGDDRVLGVRLELGGVGIGQAGHVAGVLDGGDLHAQADAQVRDAVLAGVLCGDDLALDATLAEAAGHEDRVVLRQLVGGCGRQRLGVDILDVDLDVVVHAGVAQRLVERLVRVRQLGVLAGHRDRDLALRVGDFLDQPVPATEIGRLGQQLELHADHLVQALLVEHAWHLVDRVRVPDRDHAMQRDVGEQGDLLALLVRDRAVGAAEQGVRLDADLAHLLHRVLGRLGLQLARGGDPRHVGQVDKRGVRRAELQGHLAHGFEERQRLDVTHRAADFHDRHVHRVGRADTGAAAHIVLDLVGDVRDDLHGLAEVVAAALLLQHRGVDLAAGEVVGLAHARRDEALVVAQVQVGLGAVVGDEHLAVLERRHRPRIDVQIGIQLDQRDLEATGFKNGSQGSRGDAFAQRGHDTAGDEDELGHVERPSLADAAGGWAPGEQLSGGPWW